MSDMPLFDRAARKGGGDAPEERVYRVSEVNRAVRLQLEGSWRDVWIEGELSDVTRAASGHFYFTLNDGTDPAQIRGVMFKVDARRAKARIESGERVRVKGSLSLYEPRGAFQLIARIAVPAGEGDLRAALERLRKKLDAEGLLAPERKRALPRFPRVVGLVTSKAGAAMHDVIRVASERWPVHIVVAHCQVQGEAAPASIVAAIRAIQRVSDVDVVIVGRGGGAAEDLWAFNDEGVARAIAACRVPVVSAVGHEVDVTIADLVADARASTPSNAAELTVPDARAVRSELDALLRRATRGTEVRVGRARLRLDRLAQRVADPRSALASTRRSLATLAAALERTMLKKLVRGRATIESLHRRLLMLDARNRLARDRGAFVALIARLRSASRPLVAVRRAKLGELAAHLHALSPLAILSRGYAIALHERTGKALLRAGDAAAGDRVELRLHEGRLRARVEGDS